MTISRVRSFFAEESRATGLPIGALLAAAGALHLVVTFLAVNPWHPDEHFQILEFAWARAGLAPVDSLPWEFAARIRPALQPTLALAALQALRILGITSPVVWTLVLRLGTLTLALGVLTYVCAHVSPRIGRPGRRALWLTALFLWFLPLFMSRFTSENLGGLAFVAALPLAETDRGGRRDRWLAVLLGLSFVLRFQMAFPIGALLVWIELEGEGGWTRVARVALGGMVVVAASALVDRWFYGAWVFTPVQYFRVNIVDGMAATFGTNPWYAYLGWAPLWMAPPLGLAIAALCVVGIVTRPKSLWSWTFVAFVVGHSVIGHKELRFLLPLVYLAPVLVAFGWESVADRMAERPAWRALVWLLAAQNVACAALLATPAIHRGKEFDAHYFRFLWDTAEARPDEPLYVLTADPSPYVVRDLETSVVRHPRVRDVRYTPGSSLHALIPADVPAADVLIVTRDATPPSIVGAAGFDLVYQAEPGYRVMARWVGAQDSGFVRWLERVDRWTGSEWVRRVYRMRG